MKRLQIIRLYLLLIIFVATFIFIQNILKHLGYEGSHIGGSDQGLFDKPQVQKKVLKWNLNRGFTLEDSFSYRKQVYDTNYKPVRNIAGVDCKKIVHNDKSEILKAKRAMVYINDTRFRVTPEDFLERTKNCQDFRESRGYIEHPLSQEELNFPLAFSILIYRDVDQSERLLRAIYRPHNYYCIHLDAKISLKEKNSFRKIADCFKNVHLTENSIDVKWGEFSVLEAELQCMNTIWRFKKWKYYINLTGQEFPLKTNREIVAILKAMEGANIVDGTWIRAKKEYFYRWKLAGKPPPHNIQLVKGSMHVAVNKYFVDFALHDQRSRDFLTWLNMTQVPDETFFSSLNHNPQFGIIGSFLGETEEYPLKPYFLRYKNWEIGHSVYVRKCSGKYVRNICILGIGDLHRAYNDIGLFANKFHMDFEYLSYDCLEELMYEKTWTQYLYDEHIDVAYYRHLDYVRMKLEEP